MTTESLPTGSKLTREDLARIEISRTIVSPTIAWTLIAAFAFLIGTPILVDWIAARRTQGSIPQPWVRIAALPGEAWGRFMELSQSEAANSVTSRTLAANRVVLAGFRAFEDGIVDESAVAGRVRPAAQAVLSGPLRVGNERVYQGHGGWLFYRPDVDYVIGAPFLAPVELHRRRLAPGEWIQQPQPDPRTAIVKFERQLEARGIALVVMPVPVKPAMHPEKLASPGREWTVPVNNPSYRLLLDELRRERVIVFDVGERLAQDGERSEAYLATDTHWRPETMERAAELLGEFIKGQVALDIAPDGSYDIESRTVSNVGDTATMLDLPPSHALSRAESVVIHRVVSLDGTPWRSSRDADVLVLGDSFSNIYSLASMGWGDAGGLIEHLGRTLNRPIDRIVQNDDGAYATRERLRQEIASGSDRLRGKKIVVLQFAARELASGDWRLIDLPQ
jgi:hypothetical protein